MVLRDNFVNISLNCNIRSKKCRNIFFGILKKKKYVDPLKHALACQRDIARVSLELPCGPKPIFPITLRNEFTK